MMNYYLERGLKRLKKKEGWVDGREGRWCWLIGFSLNLYRLIIWVGTEFKFRVI